MGFFDAFALVGLFLIGVPVAMAIGWLLEKLFGVAWLGRLPILAALLLAIAGVPLALHVAGQRAEGRVLDRQERLTISWRNGSWSSSQLLQVRFQPLHSERADPTTRDEASGAVTLWLPSTAEAFDRTALGATVPVTYVAFRPSVANLSDRTLGDFGRELLGVGHGRMVTVFMVVLLCLAVAGGSSPKTEGGRRLRRRALVVLGVALAGVGLRVGLTSAAQGSDEPMPAAALARVERIALVTGRPGSREPLKQPFEVAELLFTPQGAAFPVRAGDAVDRGSMRGLVAGAMVPIHYAPDHPRAVRLDGGTRTFEVRNGRDTLLEWLAWLAAFGAVGGALLWFSYVRGQLRKARAAATRPG